VREAVSANPRGNMFGVDLSQADYSQIMKGESSFYAKRAHVELLRKKWKEDKGYSSMFKKTGHARHIRDIMRIRKGG